MSKKHISLLMVMSSLFIVTSSLADAAGRPPAATQTPAVNTSPQPSVAKSLNSLPDLVVKSFKLSFVGANVFSLHIDIKNQGGTGARPNFEVSVVYEWTDEDHSKKTATRVFQVSDALAAGATKNAYFPFTSGTLFHTGNPQIVEVFVDSKNSVAESNEQNNKAVQN